MATSTRGRMAAAAAVATLATSLTLHPLVQGWGWFVAVVVVVASVAVTGAAVRQVSRSAVLVVLAQVSAFIVALTALFVRDQAVFGIAPGPEALREMGGLLTLAAQVTAEQAPPVDATRGVLFMVAGGIGLVALTVDVVAVTLRRPAVAGLPLLAVYCVPAAILPEGTSWVWFVLGALGYLALIAADNADRIRSWGRVLGDPRRSAGGERVGLVPATGGGRAAAAALARGLGVPAPGAGRGHGRVSGWGLGEGGGRSRVNVLNPILDIRANLSERSEEVALTYRTTATRPEPLRVVADEVFDGVTWSPSSASIPTSNRVQDGMPSPPGLDPGVSASVLSTSVAVSSRLGQSYLPLPYPATRVEVEGPWLYNSSTLDVLGQGVRTQGLDYEVQHLQVQPTAEQLAAAPTAPVELAATGTRLPRIPDLVRESARRVAGTGSAYEQAVRLQQWFRSSGGFQYSVDAPGDGGNDGGLEVMQAFLTEKRGYCVHFASTMAVMARSLGIPARVAVGFLPGTPQGDDEWQVTFRDAHAWPELYFEGIGWVRFEPTPQVQAGAPPTWTVPTPDADPSASASATPGSTASVAPEDRPTEEGGGAAQESFLGRVLAAVPWRVVGVLVVLGLLALIPMTLARARRWSRWRSAPTRVQRAEAAWDELRSRCADLAVSWPSSRTPRAVQRHLVAAYELGATEQEALARLVADLESARYAPPTVRGGRRREDLRADVRVAARGIAAQLPRAARRRARWLPVTAWARVDAPAFQDPAAAPAATTPPRRHEHV